MASQPHVAVVVSRYNGSITEPLFVGAAETFEAARLDGVGLIRVDAPGAFELPIIALHAASHPDCVGVLAIGCVISGETRHDEYISHSVAQALQQVQMNTGVPVGFGVLTTENIDQAQARAGGDHGNKGAESMEALLDSVKIISALTADEHLAARSEINRPDKAATGGTN